MVGYLPRWETELSDRRPFYPMEGNFSRWEAYFRRWETVLPDGRWNSPDGSLFYAMEGNFSRWTVKYIEGQADFNEAGTA
ncbi:hypothetical protein [Labilibaculum manganireducens]|nr:hypothetical protein [Labilibaculum manganireducens]